MLSRRRTAALTVAVGLGAVLSIFFATAAIGASVPTPSHGGTLVLVPAATVLRVGPGGLAVEPFTIIAPGVLLGAAVVDHTSVNGIGVYPAGAAIACGLIPYPPTYSGGQWYYSVNQSLAPGSYDWGAVCGGYGNVTVIQSIEIVFDT
jgi:hypothetical protein